jgi:hypothetical protein
MPLPVFDSLDLVPEAFRSEYEMVDGKAQSKDVAKLTLTLAKVRSDLDAATKLAKDAERAAKDADLKKSGISDEQLAALRADFQAQLEPERERASKAEAALRALRLDDKAKTLMASKEVGVLPHRIETLWKLEGHLLDLSDGGTLMVKDAPQADVTKTLAGLVTKYPEFFAAPVAAGGGAKPSTGPTGASQVDLQKLLESNPVELLRYANANPKAA